MLFSYLYSRMRAIFRFFYIFAKVLLTPWTFGQSIKLQDASYFHRSINFFVFLIATSILLISIAHKLVGRDAPFDDLIWHVMLIAIVALSAVIVWLVCKVAKPSVTFNDVVVCYCYIAGAGILLEILVSVPIMVTTLWNGPEPEWYSKTIVQFLPEISADKTFLHPCALEDSTTPISLECRAWLHSMSAGTATVDVQQGLESVVSIWSTIVFFRIVKSALGIGYWKFLGSWLLCLTLVGPLFLIGWRIAQKHRKPALSEHALSN